MYLICKWLVQSALEASVYLPQDPHSGVPFESESSRAGRLYPRLKESKMRQKSAHIFSSFPGLLVSRAIVTSPLRPLPGGDILAGLKGCLGFQLRVK